ncbi:MAG: hypothetical protein ACXV7J_07450 [Methylomonas sp.]
MQIGYPADLSCASGFLQGLAKGASCHLRQRAASLPLRFALFQQKAATLGVEKRDKNHPVI